MESENHPCLFCGAPIEQTQVDPCTAVFAARTVDDGERDSRRGARKPASWWRRPPGQYWVHASCLRGVAHPSVPLHFLDIAESG